MIGLLENVGANRPRERAPWRILSFEKMVGIHPAPANETD